MNSINDIMRMIATEYTEDSFQSYGDGQDNLPPIKYNLRVIERPDGTYEIAE